MSKKQTVIEVSIEQVETLLKRLHDQCLLPDDFQLLSYILKNYSWLQQELEKKKISINNLRKVFNIKTEKKNNIYPDENDKSNRDENNNIIEESKNKSNTKPKPKGHGRISYRDYENAEVKIIKHTELKPGNNCPACSRGKLYLLKRPAVIVKISGSRPFNAVIFKKDVLRCNLCGKCFTAQSPDPEEEKHDPTVGPLLAVLKYGCGFPLYRIAKLQRTFKCPLPASTQWDIIDKTINNIYPVYSHLLECAAQGDIFHNDDTNMKVLSLLKENKSETQERKGIYTTGIISVFKKEKEVVLFFTGRKHAGENLTKLLLKRDSNKPPPIQMCDALSRNIPINILTFLAHCLVHGRRQFVNIIDNFPDRCKIVLKLISEVYKNEKLIKKKNMDDQERLEYHQENSKPFMIVLKALLEFDLENNKVEPNSTLGKAYNYILNHWYPLTLFLREPSAPLDNNLCEQNLKKVILHRKNAMFYKTEYGAFVGDIFMSLISTCDQNGINSLEYLTAINKNPLPIRKNPELWMPWNYCENMNS